MNRRHRVRPTIANVVIDLPPVGQKHSLPRIVVPARRCPMSKLDTLWVIARVDGADCHVFCGDVEAMVAHINALHLKSGCQYAAHEAER